MPHITRRQFTTAASATAIATALSAKRVLGANERIRIGFIGVGNRGDQVLSAFLEHKDAEVVALSDLNSAYLDFSAKKIGAEPERFHDYRKLLDRKDLDAVVIAVPDHWHALMMIQAVKAGKDVYVEKPLALTVAEGRAMVKAAQATNRVVQVGIQRRSSGFCKEAADFIRGGGIGKVTAVRAFHVLNEAPLGIGRPADEDPPKGFDWDAWLGPAPKRPYNRNRTFYRFRWFYDHSGGQLTNFGVHYLAEIHWALGATAPKAAVAIGGKFADYDNREIPDTLEVLWHYPGDTLVSFCQYNASAAPGAGKSCEIEFRGTLGTLYFNTNGYEVVPDTIMAHEVIARTPIDRAKEKNYRIGAKPRIVGKKVEGKILDADHARNFLDCVKSRQTPSCDVEFAHCCTTAAHIGNIAHKLRAYVEWDAEKEQFVNNAAANKMLRYEYRKPYELPT